MEPKQPQTLGARIDEAQQLHLELKALNKQVKDLKGLIAEKEAAIFRELDEQGTTSATGSVGQAKISEDVFPSIEDWDQVYEFIKDNDAFYLLKRSMNVAPFRELLEAGQSLPGATPTTVRKISISKV